MFYIHDFIQIHVLMRKENSMNIIRLSSSIKKERQEVNNIFEEARP